MSKARFKAAVRSMPPMRHSVDGHEFKRTESQVLAWMVKQPEVLCRLFQEAQDRLVYDAATKRWHGRDWVATDDQGLSWS